MEENKLYLGNLAWELTEDELKDFVQSCGDVVGVKIIQGKGFGFVEMVTKDGAEKVKADLNGKDLKGRPVRIDDARPKKPRSDFGGSSNGGSRFRKY